MQLWCVLNHQNAYLVLSQVIYDFNWTIAITIFTAVCGAASSIVMNDWPRPRLSLTFFIHSWSFQRYIYIYKYVEQQQQQICSLCIATHFTHWTCFKMISSAFFQFQCWVNSFLFAIHQVLVSRTFFLVTSSGIETKQNQIN